MRAKRTGVAIIAVLVLFTASAIITSPAVGAQEAELDVSKSTLAEEIGLTVGEPTVVSEVAVGDRIEIESSAAIPELPAADGAADLEFVAYADGDKLGTQQINIEDGDSTTISITHSFQETGSKEVYFEVSGEVTRERMFTSSSASINWTTPSVTVDVVERRETVTEEGAVFGTPTSVQEEVGTLRERQLAETVSAPYTLVLATPDELYLVMTDEKPREGYAVVNGTEVGDTNISLGEQGDLELNPVLAEAVNYTEPSRASVSDVYENQDEYDRSYVELSATHRSVSVVLGENQSEYTSTTGVLIDDPRQPAEYFENIGGASYTLVDEFNNKTVGSVLGNRSQPHIVTTAVGTEPEYWENTPVTMTGIVVSPNTLAGEFIQQQQQNETLPLESRPPILYVTEIEYDTQEVSVSELRQNSTRYQNKTVRFTSNLYMSTVSSQRVVEAATGTKLPPVDVTLHGGVAWEGVPETRNETIGLIAASSAKQDSLTDVRRGTYTLTGEVVTTDQVVGDFPQGQLLIAYNLERTDPLNTTAATERIESQSTEIATVLRQQVNPNVDANLQPIANAGPDQTVPAGERVRLNASGSRDPDGGAVTYEFRQIAGPTVSIQDTRTATPEFTAPDVSSSTTLTFELTVTDSTGANATDTVNITVQAETVSIEPINGQLPTDTTGDGKLNDINGDRKFDIFDIQALYNNLESDPVQQNPELFDFDMSGGTPSIFDVQALYSQLRR